MNCSHLVDFSTFFGAQERLLFQKGQKNLGVSEELFIGKLG